MSYCTQSAHYNAQHVMKAQDSVAILFPVCGVPLFRPTISQGTAELLGVIGWVGRQVDEGNEVLGR